MEVIFKSIAIIAILAIRAGHGQVEFTHAVQENTIVWCTISIAEQYKCEKLSQKVEEIRNALTVPPGAAVDMKTIPRTVCDRGHDVFDCMSKIENGVADIINLDSGQGYFAGRFHNMLPLVAESTELSQDAMAQLQFRAVAVVKRNSNMNIGNLQGKKTCHSGIGTSAGWIYPMGELLRKEIIKLDICNAPVDSISKFFSGGMCLPGSLNSFYNPFGNNPVEVCLLCSGFEDTHCTSADPYAGYDGAFRCMAQGIGDIAFVRDNTVQMMVEYPGSIYNSDDYELICPNGQRAAVQDVDNCNFGSAPAHAVMTSAAKIAKTVQSYKNYLLQLSKWFQRNGPYYNQFKLFSSNYTQYQRGNLLFTDGTQTLEDVGEDMNYYNWVDDGFRNQLQKLSYCPLKLIRWCIISEQERQKCEDMIMAFRAKDLKPDLDCVSGSNTMECVRMIRYGEADIMSIDAGDVYYAGRDYGLVPIAKEDYGDMTGSFKVVAAARKQDAYTTLFNLKGKRSCQGGIHTGDGWVIPATIFIETVQIRPEECTLLNNVGELFSRSCIPGSLDYHYNPAGKPINLCEGCAAGSYRKCQRNNQEQYYKATGAFRCLVEYGGDVAFVRHWTIRQNTDGRNEAIWARNRRSDDYEIMCKDGSRKPIEDWKSCNLGSVPANAIVVGRHKTAKEREMYWQLLNYGQMFFSTDKESDFSMFDSGLLYNDLLFTDSTIRLLQIEPAKQGYREYLGIDFVSMIERLTPFTCYTDEKADNPSSVSGLHFTAIHILAGLLTTISLVTFHLL